MTLPNDIQEIFFETLNGDKNLIDFEQWLYADKRLESLLSSEDYLELISYGYQTETAIKWLYKLLDKHIDRGEFEKRRLLKLLTKVQNKKNELPDILRTFYDLYCKGYYFLDNLGFGYGLTIKVPRAENISADSWDELSSEQQRSILSSFYPGIVNEAQKVIGWLIEGKIVLTGLKDEDNHFTFIDNRTVKDKLPTAYEVAKTNKNI